uniref:Uncharacterized protein n=1 Tax=Opuntia streptacantha TaxID=393608 RepID=A0A7C8ZPM7_OPUST
MKMNRMLPLPFLTCCHFYRPPLIPSRIQNQVHLRRQSPLEPFLPETVEDLQHWHLHSLFSVLPSALRQILSTWLDPVFSKALLIHEHLLLGSDWAFLERLISLHLPPSSGCAQMVLKQVLAACLILSCYYLLVQMPLLIQYFPHHLHRQGLQYLHKNHFPRQMGMKSPFHQCQNLDLLCLLMPQIFLLKPRLP